MAKGVFGKKTYKIGDIALIDDQIMPNYRRLTVAGETYFITQVTYQRDAWLCDRCSHFYPVLRGERRGRELPKAIAVLILILLLGVES